MISFIFVLQLSVQGAFVTAYLLHTLKHLLIDLGVDWTDVFEAVYKVLCECGIRNDNTQSILCIFVTLVVIGFTVPLVSFVLIIIPLMMSLTTYR